MFRTTKGIAKNICPLTIPTKSLIFVSDFEGFFQSLEGCIVIMVYRWRPLCRVMGTKNPRYHDCLRDTSDHIFIGITAFGFLYER